jgi:cytochrome bd-type quinol oxidase subunit 1
MSGSSVSQLMVIIYGVFILLGIYCLYLFIKLATRGVQALDIYLDEKKNRRL